MSTTPFPSPPSPSSSQKPPTATDRQRVLLCAELEGEALDTLQSAADVDVFPDLDEQTLLEKIPHYQAVVVGPDVRLTSDVLKYGFKLRAVGCLCPHLDNIEVSTARALGLPVIHAPAGNAVAIAEHTMAVLLQLATRFGDGRLAGKTLGLIGFGPVGREVARRALAFDMRVIVNQPRLTAELALAVGVEAADFPELLGRADFVSVHVPYKAVTEPIIGAGELGLMKAGACLVNPGHTELIDNHAIWEALSSGRLAGAAISVYPIDDQGTLLPGARRLRDHPRVLVAPHVTTILTGGDEDAALEVTQKIADLLRTHAATDTLSLELAPTELIMPHEEIDEKRVQRLMERLEEDGRLVNPPIAVAWEGRYIILDGATRYTAMKRLGFPALILQVVQPGDEFQLHTWYHAISSAHPLSRFLEEARAIDGLELAPLSPAAIAGIFDQEDVICYFLDREGRATAARLLPGADRASVMRQLVFSYTVWGEVERTLHTSLSRLVGQFPRLSGLTVFPQLQPEAVFTAARQGSLLPAGLTRFVIPGRILRLNADLARLRRDEALATKRSWFNRFLQEKLAVSRLRYYEEPVILLDE